MDEETIKSIDKNLQEIKTHIATIEQILLPFKRVETAKKIAQSIPKTKKIPKRKWAELLKVFRKLPAYHTVSSLHVNEECYEYDGKFYQVLSAVGDDECFEINELMERKC